MLGEGGYCRTPITALQPNEPLWQVSIPMDGVMTSSNAQGYFLSVRGRYCKALYLVTENVWIVKRTGQLPPLYAWRTQDSVWHLGERAHWLRIKDQLPVATSLKNVTLPPLPMLPVNALPIPKKIHYIWLGNSVPNQTLIDNLVKNVRNANTWELIVHVEGQTPDVLALIRRTFAAVAPSLQISELQGTAFFSAFTDSDHYAQFKNVMQGPGQNFSAASDVLRYPLNHHYGGVYMDMDDSFTVDIRDLVLPAAPNDLLMGALVTEEMADFVGYNSSIFASHANNPVLLEISREMHARYQQSNGFFDQVRPRVGPDGVARNPGESALDMPAYAKELFRLTGPKVLNDVLAIERPDYYRLSFNARASSDIVVTHDLWDQGYVNQLFERISHYFPFESKAYVDIGHEHSWFDS